MALGRGNGQGSAGLWAGGSHCLNWRRLISALSCVSASVGAVKTWRRNRPPARLKEIRLLGKAERTLRMKLCGDRHVRVSRPDQQLWGLLQGLGLKPLAPYKTREPDCLAQRIPVGSGHHLLLWFLILLSPQGLGPGFHLPAQPSAWGHLKVARPPCWTLRSPREMVCPQPNAKWCLLSSLIPLPRAASENPLPPRHWGDPTTSPLSTTSAMTKATTIPWTGFPAAALAAHSRDLWPCNKPPWNFVGYNNTHFIIARDSEGVGWGSAGWFSCRSPCGLSHMGSPAWQPNS